MSDDKRKSTRVDSQLFISFSILNEMGSPSEGGMALALNISSAGMMIENRNPLHVGSILEMIIAVGTETIKIRGLIKHVDPKEDQFHIGIEFKKVSSEEIELIKKYYPDISS